MTRIQVPDGVEVKYTVNRDDPEYVWMNVYHLKVDPAVRGQGLASRTIESLTDFAASRDQIDAIVVTMQAPEEQQDIIEHLFLEKFDYDSLRGPYPHSEYDEPIVEVTKQVN